jgi:hypothetical protein
MCLKWREYVDADGRYIATLAASRSIDQKQAAILLFLDINCTNSEGN